VTGDRRPVFAAVDLGASSGRVITGAAGRDGIELTEAHRFPNRPVRVGATLHWDILALYQGVLDGLAAAAARHGRLAGIGVDSWAVDYGLLDARGGLLGNPVHYRDERTGPAVEQAAAAMPLSALYSATGIAFQPFNTVFQFVADREALSAASQALLVPDLLSYWLTGVAGTELTNASTTGLLDPRTRQWSTEIGAALGIDLGVFAPLRSPGDEAGEVVSGVRAETGLADPVPVYAVGSHDTASAVVGVPAADERFAYISSGTWSLVGVELDAPVRTDAAREANFTNELGVDGTVRFLRNVMGLWLLQECQRTWGTTDLAGLLARADASTPLRSVVDATDPRFLAPGDMPARIAAYCRETGQPEPREWGEFVRCVLDSLALAYRAAVADAVRLSGHPVQVVHVVGGGVRNEVLCRLTADACGLPVVAGPVEAAALGNVLVQARAAGVVGPDLADLRALVRSTQPLRRYEPAGDPAAWQAAADRLANST
jgi:rhamnulokinase